MTAMALACCAALPSAAQATLVGDTVLATELYPDTSSSLGSTGPFVILPGGTDFGTVGQSAVDVIVAGTTITFDALFAYTPLVATFDGFDIEDLDLSTTITGVSLTSGFLPAGNLSFGAHDVLINLSGVPLDPDKPIVLSVTSADTAPPGVPEPAAWAMLLMGFGGLGAALRARRPVRGAVSYA